MKMPSTKLVASGPPQRRKFENVENVMKEERQVLLKRSEAYNKMLTKEVVEYDSRNEINLRNAEYRRLLAEKQVLENHRKNKIQSFRIPNNTDFLFELARSSLENDIEMMQNTLTQQEDIIEKDKKELDSLQQEQFLEEGSNVEDDEVMLELMKCLHKKLTARFKKLVQLNFSPSSANSSDLNSHQKYSEKNQPNYFLEVLQELLPELSSSSEFEFLEDVVLEVAKENVKPQLKRKLQLLSECAVVEMTDNEDSIWVTIRKP